MSGGIHYRPESRKEEEGSVVPLGCKGNGSSGRKYQTHV
jgi:hypothetical protein